MLRCLVFLGLLAVAAMADDIRLIGHGETWKLLKGTNEPPTIGGKKWFEPSYADSDWSTGRSSFGTPGAYAEVTILPDYAVAYTTVYFRKTFLVNDPLNVAELLLRADYDDGLVIYLNGVEVARRGAPGNIGAPVPVTASAPYHPRGSAELIPLTTAIHLLRPGTNTLAVQVLGTATSDFGMAFNSELLANVIRGPYVQNTTTSSVQVVWATFGAARAEIEFGKTLSALQRITISTNATNHVATLEGLQPGTEYFYRLINQFGPTRAVGEWKSFTTFKNSGRISFDVMGDSGTGSHGQLLVADELKKSQSDFLMHVGDLVYYAITQQNADLRMLSVYAEEMQRRPWFLAVGNHEMYWDTNAALQVFHLPTNSVTGTEHYYSFDHGDVHFAVAWSDLQARAAYYPGSPQYEWLDADLARSTKPWKFLFFHHVWRSSSYHQIDDYDLNQVLDTAQLDEGLAGLARKHGVQIIFNGHDHCYERLAPNGGPISFVSGGGGATPYWFAAPHADSVQFYNAYHFLRVTVDGDEARVEAVGTDGSVFDRVHIRRNFPQRAIHNATWHTPNVESAPANDGDGNLFGQRFDFLGNAFNGPMGLFSSAGRLFVNNDRTNIYFGFDEVMLTAGEELFLFIEVPGLPGKPDLIEIGNGVVDANGEGADALDFLENVAFENFSPSVAVVLGDEFGDASQRSFMRSGQSMSNGQGAFYLTEGLSEIPGQKLSQFNRSPQTSAVLYEQNSDYIELAIPMRALAGVKPGDIIRVGVITALPGIDTTTQQRAVDTGGIGYSVLQQNGTALVEGMQIRLASLPDADGDLLSDSEEARLATNPSDSDSDDDGMPDGWETIYGLLPLANDSAMDPDGDGLSNAMEYRAGTNPTDAQSRLWLESLKENDRLRLTWSSVAGKRYKLQFRNSLLEPFQDLTEPTVFAEGSRITRWIDLGSQPATRYYRVQLIE
ncbi:MAG TPA: metallophosphoesterase [Verrucomicrobiae bacterium]